MADFRRLKAFRELVDLVDAEFTERGMPLKPGAAADMVAEGAERIASQLGITPRSALAYLSADAFQDLARATARSLKEHEAAEDAHPPVSLSSKQAGMVISAFAVASRLGVVNGDPDVAADLCEVITGISVGLRGGPPVEVPALLLSNGLEWARLSADKLSTGAWTLLPGKTGPEDDERVAARLGDDLEAIDRLLR